MEKSETQKYVQELQKEIDCLKHENELLVAKCKEFESIHWDKVDELENRHQANCITINHLNVTIDTLVDKLARLRELRQESR